MEKEYNASGWISICAASAILFVGVGYTNTFGVFSEYYQSTLFPSEPADKIIVIGSVAASLYFVLGAFSGRLADRIGYRSSLIAGSALMILSMFTASVSKEYWSLFLSQGITFGCGLALVYPPTTSISRQYFGPGRHGLANGIVVSGGALGGCVLPYTTRQLIQTFGLASTFRVLGYIAVGVLVPSVALIRPKARRQSQTKTRRIFDAQLTSNGFFWVLTLACTTAMTGFLPRYFLIPTSAVSKGISSTYASWLLGIMNGLSILGRIGLGVVADRFGPVEALSASFILCAVGHLGFWLPGVATDSSDGNAPKVLFTTFVVFVGIFGSGFISLFPVVVAHLFGKDNLASKTGLLNAFVGLSTLAGPSAVYAIVGGGSDRRWTFGILTAGLFMLFGGLTLAAAAVVTNKKGSLPSRAAERRTP